VFGWTIDEPTSFAVLDAFVAGGATMIDTADVYYAFAPGNVGGESETILGRWMKARGNRDRVQIATKVGALPIRDGRKGLAPDVIAEAIDASLARLQTDYVDLYYAHVDDAATPQEAVAEAFDRLVRAGKVRAIGASNFSAERLESALAIAEGGGLARYGVLQPHFNLVESERFPAGYRRLCAERDVGALTYWGLASGFLTGKYRSAEEASRGSRAHSTPRYFNARGEKVLAALDAVAAETGATPAQIALAWVMATPGVTGPIASATSPAQAESLLGSMELALGAGQMAALDAAAATPV
jgi:aryl-alcohol dehydrogenase-like predicted oxidoreductase